jgi:hypothetical protein
MKLSANFTLRELTRSGTAMRRGIENQPGNDEMLNLKALCQSCLQPIRDKFGPVTILSGYRSPELNRAVGGSKTSAHPHGYAADITVPGYSTREVALWVAQNLPHFDQVIDEFGRWVHIGMMRPATENQRGELLECLKVDGLTQYRSIARD